MTRVGRRLGLVGAGLLAVITLMAIFAPLLAGNGPNELNGAPFQPPSPDFPLGSDDVGHDLFSQLLHGARVSLAIGLISALLATAIGLGIALLAGYVRGRIEAPLMRVVDLALAFPFFVLVIVLAAFLGRELLITAIVISSVLWAEPARVLYSDVIKVGEFQHVLAARGMGASPARVMTRHVIPRLAPLGVSQFVRTANTAVFLEAALAFLGLGDPNRVSWGSMLFYANSRSAFLTDAWLWWILPPGLALTAVLVGFAFVGYAIEERADPRLRNRRGRGAGRRAAPTASSTAADQPPAPQAPGTVLEVRGLSVAYRTGEEEVRAVDGVSFAVARRSVVGLVGESGSGKTSMALALLGLMRPPGRVVEGEIMLNGRDVRRLRGPEAGRVRGREIAMVPQGAMSALNPAYTVHRQVAEVAALTREDRQAAQRRASEVLEGVGIETARHGAYAHELSGGMRQRVTIAMAVANEPSLIVADEPVTGLDVVTQAKILALLAELRDRLGLTLILISHDLRLAARVSDELLVMQDGQVVESGCTDTLTASPQHAHTRALLEASPGVRELEARS